MIPSGAKKSGDETFQDVLYDLRRMSLSVSSPFLYRLALSRACDVREKRVSYTRNDISNTGSSGLPSPWAKWITDLAPVSQSAGYSHIYFLMFSFPKFVL